MLSNLVFGRLPAGYQVPPRPISVPHKFQREGIKYKDLSDEEQERWNALEWTEDDTVDKVLEHLMTCGE